MDNIYDLIEYSMIASFISTQVIQKIKETANPSALVTSIISIVVSFIAGVCLCLSFSGHSFVCSIWVGLFTIIGSDTFYKKFKGLFGLKSSKDS